MVTLEGNRLSVCVWRLNNSSWGKGWLIFYFICCILIITFAFFHTCLSEKSRTFKHYHWSFFIPVENKIKIYVTYDRELLKTILCLGWKMRVFSLSFPKNRFDKNSVFQLSRSFLVCCKFIKNYFIYNFTTYSSTLHYLIWILSISVSGKFEFYFRQKVVNYLLA